MGVRRIDFGLCNGCGICVERCPMDVFRMDKEAKKAFIKYVRDCQSCFLCVRECPENAIDAVPIFERRMPLAW